MGHPVVGGHGVGLHQRNDHEAAAEGERADLERGPGERARSPAGRHGASNGQRSTRRARAAPRRRARARRRPSSTSTSHGPAVAARRSAGERVGDPAQRVRAAARRQIGGATSRRRCTATAATAAPAPSPAPRTQRGGEPARNSDRQREDRDEPGHDEAGPADERAAAPAQPPRAVDRQLRRGRPGQQVASRRSRARTRARSASASRRRTASRSSAM